MKNKLNFLKENKKIVINICAVLALILIVTGTTIAGGYWNYISKDANSISTGEVSLTYLESTSEINLKNALPMSDNDGKLLSEKGAKFEFAVTSNSDNIQTIKYDINIEPLVVDTGLTGLNPEDVKVYLTDKEGNTLVEPTKLSKLNDFKLYSDKHDHKKQSTKITSKYILRAWIDKDVEASDWYKEYKDENKQYQYKFRININGEAVEYKNEPNAPVLDSAMIPVYYDENTETWKKADSSNKDNNWYKYDSKKWANSVTVSSTNRSKYQSASVGTEIAMDDILTMQVWIPRYKYKVWNYNSDGTVSSNEQEIEITWEEGTAKTGEITCTDSISGTDGSPSETCKIGSTTCTDSTCNNKTYTHPAFTFGDEEIKGFWIGKFELTGTIDSITTKPNLSSLRSQTISSFETNIMKMKNSDNSYGFSTSTDTHMIKNSEWGAVAYLSHSKYGTCTDGICKEVNINNSSSYYTGRSGGGPGGSTAINTVYTDQTSTTQYNSYGFYTYDGYLLNYNTNTKSTTKDMSKVASTTHNIYGVYDMSGGAWENTMSNIVSSDGTTMEPGRSGYTISTYPNVKYYDKYSGNDDFSVRKGSKLGDGIKEVYNTNDHGWYSDNSYFVDVSLNPWFKRGGYYGYGEKAGVFSSLHNGKGEFFNNSSISSHLIITPTN